LRSTGDKWLLSILLSNMGHQARQRGDLGTASALYAESLALERELGNRAGICFQLQNLGEINLALHEYAEAEVRFEEALAIAPQLGDPCSGVIQSFNLSLAALGRGDRQRAVSLCQQALILFRQWEHQKVIGKWLGQLAALAMELGLRLPVE